LAKEKDKSQKRENAPSEKKEGQKRVEKPEKADKIAEDMRGIIRIAGKDVKGHVPLWKALYHVKGVGKRYALICADVTAQKTGLDINAPVGKLTDAQVGEIEEIITKPLENGIPSYMVNRRREYSSGKDMHLISSDLDFAVKQDVDRDIKTRTWRGISHMYRKKVRGQRTRTSGRRGGSVGVVKKKLKPGETSAPAAKKEEKK